MHVCAPTPEVPKWRGRGENAYNTMYHYVLGASDVITYLLPIRPARPRAVPRTSRRRRSRPASCRSIACRWIFFAAGTVLFAARIHAVKGFYLVTYGLAIALTNNLVGLLNPKVCPPAKPFYHASHDACGVSFAVPVAPPATVVLHLCWEAQQRLHCMMSRPQYPRRDEITAAVGDYWRGYDLNMMLIGRSARQPLPVFPFVGRSGSPWWRWYCGRDPIFLVFFFFERVETQSPLTPPSLPAPS